MSNNLDQLSGINYNPFTLLIEKSKEKEFFIITDYSKGKRKIIAFGFPTTSDAQIWIDEKQLEFVLS